MRSTWPVDIFFNLHILSTMSLPKSLHETNVFSSYSPNRCHRSEYFFYDVLLSSFFVVCICVFPYLGVVRLVGSIDHRHNFSPLGGSTFVTVWWYWMWWKWRFIGHKLREQCILRWSNYLSFSAWPNYTTRFVVCVVRSLVRRAIQSMRSTFNLQVTFHLKGMYSLYIQFT